MTFLKNIFGKKEGTIKTDNDLWTWFLTKENTFFNVVKSGKNLEKDFINQLSPKLDEINDGFYFSTGMFDENTAELILTPDGIIKNIVFVDNCQLQTSGEATQRN